MILDFAIQIFRLKLLALAMAASILPGSERWADPLLQIDAEEVAEDPAPLGGAEHELALVVEWEAKESAMGRGLSGKRWDSKAFGVLQIRGPSALERDPRASVRTWLSMLHASAALCGEGRATAGLSSGACDRAVGLARRREREADGALADAEHRLKVAAADVDE